MDSDYIISYSGMSMKEKKKNRENFPMREAAIHVSYYLSC
jgi:hypothetical protein